MPFLVPAVVNISTDLAMLLTVSRQTSKPVSLALPAQWCQREWGHARNDSDHTWRAAQAGKKVPGSISKHEDT